MRCDGVHTAQCQLGLNDRHAHVLERIGAVNGQLVACQHTVGILLKLQVTFSANDTHTIFVVDQLKGVATNDLNVHCARQIITA